MSKEFEALRAADEAGMPTVLDTYGAKDPAEFFAVLPRRSSSARAYSVPNIQNCTPNWRDSSARILFATLPSSQRLAESSRDDQSQPECEPHEPTEGPVDPPRMTTP